MCIFVQRLKVQACIYISFSKNQLVVVVQCEHVRSVNKVVRQLRFRHETAWLVLELNHSVRFRKTSCAVDE